MAWVLGDPAGIGPELVAKSLANPDKGKVFHPVVVGPIWLLERGMQIAKVKLATTRYDPSKTDAVPPGTVPVVDTGWPEQEFRCGVLSAAAGKLCIEMLKVAV